MDKQLVNFFMNALYWVFCCGNEKVLTFKFHGIKNWSVTQQIIDFQIYNILIVFLHQDTNYQLQIYFYLIISV